MNEAEAWLRLALIPGLGPVAFREILSAFGSPESALDAPHGALSRLVGDELTTAIHRGPEQRLLEETQRWLALPGNALLTLADAGYPQSLLQISHPPPLLYAKGRVDLLAGDAIAVVGSRNATPAGIANAEAFARELSDAGFAVISGLALGIDAAAHRGGLKGQAGSMAVIGTGMDIVYPARNQALAHELAERGLLLSEFPLGTKPLAANFPRRNRIISGLARGVLVVEAALQSGSLITARYALEQGREVFAIPGSIHSPLSKGTHQLIKQGAKLVESAQDILEEFGSSRSPARDEELAYDDNAPMLAAMGFDPIDLDTLCIRCGLTAESASAMLLTLELDGRIARLPGGKFQRIR
jgi:DNA processing protein